MDKELYTIGIVGSGNVGTRFGVALAQQGFTVKGVLSRNEQHACELAEHIASLSGKPCAACTKAHDLPAVDILFLTVADDAILPQIQTLSERRAESVFVHTAGSVPMSVFDGIAHRYGVVYPLQTLSKKREIYFSQVPLFVEGSDDVTAFLLESLARKLSMRVQRLDSESRKNLHLSAVFACNFPNALLGIAEGLLADAHVERGMLEPLVSETLSKFLECGADASQTGPAVRADQKVLDRQLAMLEDKPDVRDIYNAVTQYIHNRYVRNQNK